MLLYLLSAPSLLPEWPLPSDSHSWAASPGTRQPCLLPDLTLTELQGRIAAEMPKAPKPSSISYHRQNLYFPTFLSTCCISDYSLIHLGLFMKTICCVVGLHPSARFESVLMSFNRFYLIYTGASAQSIFLLVIYVLYILIRIQTSLFLWICQPTLCSIRKHFLGNNLICLLDLCVLEIPSAEDDKQIRKINFI